MSPTLQDETGGVAAAPGRVASGPAPLRTFDPEAWRFRFALYGWSPSVAGSLTAPGQTVDVNASFIQIVQKSDSLLFYMGYFETEKGRVDFYLDTVWARLGFDSSTTSFRNPIAGLQISTSSNTAVTYSFAIIEAGGLYEIARWPGSPGAFTALDGLRGFRFSYSGPSGGDSDRTHDLEQINQRSVECLSLTSRISSLFGETISASRI